MAWIAIHDQIDGMKLRRFRKATGCSKCEAIGVLVALWLWARNNADRDGKLVDADLSDVEELFENGLSRKLSTKSIVTALVSTGWIDDNSGDLFIHDWPEWQKEWYQALDRREKDKRRKGFSKENSNDSPRNFHGKSSATVTVTKPLPSPHPTVIKNESTSAAAPEEGFPVGFADFWNSYPMRVKKQDALRAWKKQKADKCVPVVMAALERFKNSRGWKKDSGQYIPYPASWLNDRRWEDENIDGVDDKARMTDLDELF